MRGHNRIPCDKDCATSATWKASTSSLSGAPPAGKCDFHRSRQTSIGLYYIVGWWFVTYSAK